MHKFIQHQGQIVPLDQANIDTDQIIPKQFLKSTKRIGFGKHLFHDWRYADTEGEQNNPDFILNKPKYKNASILITGKNFGCGSSREHAPWALQEYGFKVIIAPGFADIFYANCFNIGLLPVVLSEDNVNILLSLAAEENINAEIDLQAQTINIGKSVYAFAIDNFHKHCLLEGIDAIDWTLQSEDDILNYENSIPSWR